jgi:Fe-S-cluster containining protein
MSALSDNEIRERLISYTCQRNCCGVAEQSGICCTLGDKDWILGPIEDHAEVLKRLEDRLGRPVPFVEVFIDYEEGRALFPDKSSWQNPAHYPAMRVVPDAISRYSCAFLKGGKCSIHEIKPTICASFLCEYLQKVVRSVVGS